MAIVNRAARCFGTQPYGDNLGFASTELGRRRVIEPESHVHEIAEVVHDIQPETKGVPDEFLPFDLKAALAIVDGKSSLLRKMMFSFRDQYFQAVLALCTHLGEGRKEEAESLAHSLSISAASLCANKLAAAALAVENALRTGQMDGLIELLALLEAALGPALAAAGSLLADKHIVAETSEVCSLLSDGRPTILVVDDDPTSIEFMREIFEGPYRVVTSGSGIGALALSVGSKPDLILLDVMMPETDGYEVCRLLKNRPETREIPVVFLTGLSDQIAEIRGLAMGAADFVHKPIDTALVCARVANLIKLRQTQRDLVNLLKEQQMEKLALLAQRFLEEEELNTKIKKALADKEVLLKEVHHRVKNNLQVICSMLSMQAGALKDETAIAALQNTQRRVHSMAVIHDLLYGSNNLSNMDFSAYAIHLLRELAATFGINSSRVKLSADTAPQMLDVNHAIPCGLILNELATNALKYAFPEDRPGKVVVSFGPGEPGTMRLTVKDNGIGLPKPFEILKARSIGLRIVQILVKQLNGHLTISSNDGATFVVTFPFVLTTSQRTSQPMQAA